MLSLTAAATSNLSVQFPDVTLKPEWQEGVIPIGRHAWFGVVRSRRLFASEVFELGLPAAFDALSYDLHAPHISPGDLRDVKLKVESKH